MLTQPMLWCLSYVHTSTYHFNFKLFLLHDPNFRLPLFLLTSFKILSPWTRAISLKSTHRFMLMDHHPLNSISAQPPFQLESPYPGRLSSICLTISVEAFLRVLTSWLSFELFRGCELHLCCRVLTPRPRAASCCSNWLSYQHKDIAADRLQLMEMEITYSANAHYITAQWFEIWKLVFHVNTKWEGGSGLLCGFRCLCDSVLII